MITVTSLTKVYGVGDKAVAAVQDVSLHVPPGATTVEQTGGRWITYQGFVPSKGKRGVAAWRVKPGPGGTSIQV